MHRFSGPRATHILFLFSRDTELVTPSTGPGITLIRFKSSVTYFRFWAALLSADELEMYLNIVIFFIRQKGNSLSSFNAFLSEMSTGQQYVRLSDVGILRKIGGS